MMLKQLMLYCAAALMPTVHIRERVTLQLPITKKDEIIFSIKRKVKSGVSLEYVIRTKKVKQIIRTVKFSDFTLLDVRGECDADTRKRTVTVTVTAAGIFVKIKTVKKNKKHYEDYFRVDGKTYMRLVDEWDYMKFVHPHRYRKLMGVDKYPYPMIIFMPVFEPKIQENVLYTCSYDWYWHVLRGKTSRKFAETLAPGLDIVRLKTLKHYSVKLPQPGMYRIMKSIYETNLTQNDAKHMQSFMVKEYFYMPTEKLNCATVTNAVKAYLKFPRKYDSLYNPPSA